MLARYNIGGRGIQQAHDILSANVCVPFCIINPKDYSNIPISSCGEAFTRRPITIDSSGNLRICNHSPAIIGNIHSDSIQKMAESDYVNSWKTTQPTNCQTCAQWIKCRGGCRAASEQIGKSLDNKDPVTSSIIR
ncbi:MAG TPA: SPASM domain-containing protein [Chitinispirillaceae bacterium]|nr:SPASM domain-containing protein [Chitinispirillaceae bacterium]